MSDISRLEEVDLHAQSGRTGHRLCVTDAKSLRSNVRHALGTTRDDTPNVEWLLRAATDLSKLLFDASEGALKLSVVFDGDKQHLHPAIVLSTIKQR